MKFMLNSFRGWRINNDSAKGIYEKEWNKSVDK